MEYKVRTRFSGERLFSNSPRDDHVPLATLATRHSGRRAVRAAVPVTSSIRVSQHTSRFLQTGEKK